MTRNYNPVARTDRELSPHTAGEQMDTVQDQSADNAGQTAGNQNHNWNLRDKFENMQPEEYDLAVKHGFRGTQEEWVAFLDGITQVDMSALIGIRMPPCWQGTEEQEPAPVSDAEMRIAAAKASRANVHYRTGPFVRLVLWLTALFVLVLAATVATIGWVYENKVVSKRVVDHRPCYLKQDGIEVTGDRSYSYINNELYGLRWSTIDTLYERTEVKVTMKGMTVVAITPDKKSKTLWRGEGEGGILILPEADYYAFFINGRATSVAYSALCE